MSEKEKEQEGKSLIGFLSKFTAKELEQENNEPSSAWRFEDTKEEEVNKSWFSKKKNKS